MLGCQVVDVFDVTFDGGGGPDKCDEM